MSDEVTVKDVLRAHVLERSRVVLDGKAGRTVKVVGADGKVLREATSSDLMQELLKREAIEAEVVEGAKVEWKIRGCARCRRPFVQARRFGGGAAPVECQKCLLIVDACAGCGVDLPNSRGARYKRRKTPRPWFGKACGCFRKKVSESHARRHHVVTEETARKHSARMTALHASRTPEQRSEITQRSANTRAAKRALQE